MAHQSLRRAWRFRFTTMMSLAIAGMVSCLLGTTSASAGVTVIPLPPFHECPSVGDSPSCQILLVVEPGGTITIYDDSGVGDYDGGDDSLVGILNNSDSPVPAITVSGIGSDLGGFDGDGLCTYLDCSYGPTGYEGPGTSFVKNPASDDEVEVDFSQSTHGLPSGQSAYFSLEGTLTAATLKARTGPLGDSGPVLMIHGIDPTPPPANQNCAKYWDDAKSYLREHGYAGRQLLTIGYYEDDSHCDKSINKFVNTKIGDTYMDTGGHAYGGGHTRDESIEHLGYHLAWFIYDQYTKKGTSVDVLAHSMGGLIIRYALTQTQKHNPAFPPKLMVSNVVTFATPHGGAREVPESGCGIAYHWPLECLEMLPGSELLVGLQRDGWNPQGAGGTDWSAFGSDDDNAVAADRAVGTSRNRQHDAYFGGCHKYWIPSKGADGFKQPIEHSDYMHDGTIAGGMNATGLTMYVNQGSCGAPLVAQTEPHPMAIAALALSSPNY